MAAGRFRRREHYGRTGGAESPVPAVRREEHGLSATLSIVISIFGLIGLGYLSGRVGLLSTVVGERLNEFVFTLAIPSMGMTIHNTHHAFPFTAYNNLRGWWVVDPAGWVIWVMGKLGVFKNIKVPPAAWVKARRRKALRFAVPLTATIDGQEISAPGLDHDLVIAPHSTVLWQAKLPITGPAGTLVQVALGAWGWSNPSLPSTCTTPPS